MTKIPKDIQSTVEDSGLDDLINAYVFSANFDGVSENEMRAIQKWVSEAILAERERCAEVARKYFDAGGHDAIRRAAGLEISVAILAAEDE